MQQPPGEQRPKSRWRVLYFTLGLLFFGLGMVGAVLPGLPTTPFLLLALWAFSRSSPRLHDWLRAHPRWGARLRDFQDHGIIPRRVKVTALGAMSASFLVMAFVSRVPGWVLLVAGGVMVWGATFILARPSEPSVEPPPEP